MQAQTGAPSPPSTRADYQRTVADARQVLGTERFETAWAAGAAMGLDAAVDLALAPPQHEEAAPVRKPTETAIAAAHPGVALSPREQEVVTLIAQGFSNRQISERLTLSVRTVERHIENVYNRLGISGKAGRAIVTAYALRHGLVPGTGCQVLI
jgi:DNA-binding NarL/FixJ family response regulator